MEHDTGVKWADVTLELTEQQLDEWDCWKEPVDVNYWIQYAKGPCPECKATAQGYTTNREGPIDEALIVTDEAEAVVGIKVPVSCSCGYAHGNEKATDCGRDWVVTCPLAGDEVAP
jgi:hypothetical protein